MTLSEIIPSILNGLVGGRVWQDATPEELPRDINGDILPFIIWFAVGGQEAEYVEQSPMPTKRNARVQIECAMPRQMAVELDQLSKAARDALVGSSYTVGVYGSPVGTYDAARKLRVKRQQFSIWFQQS